MRLTFDEKQSTIEVSKPKQKQSVFRAEIAKRETVCSQANGYIWKWKCLPHLKRKRDSLYIDGYGKLSGFLYRQDIYVLADRYRYRCIHIYRCRCIYKLGYVRRYCLFRGGTASVFKNRITVRHLYHWDLPLRARRTRAF